LTVAVVGGGGGDSAVDTEKKAKIAKEHSSAWHFGHEGLANCRFFIKVCERSKGLLISIKNVKNISIRRITAS
jgi:hypothetical protein